MQEEMQGLNSYNYFVCIITCKQMELVLHICASLTPRLFCLILKHICIKKPDPSV